MRHLSFYVIASVVLLCGCQRDTSRHPTISFGQGAPCNNYGDSITAGYYASPANGSGNVYSLNGYATLLDNYEGWTCVNNGFSASQLQDSEEAGLMINTVIQPNSISTILTGANDMRSTYCTGCSGGMSTATAQAQYMGELESTMAWLAIPAGSKTTAQACPGTPSNPSCVFTGSWINASAVGVKETSTPGSTVKVYLVGTATYFSSLQQFGNTSTYSLTIDGIPVPSQTGGIFFTNGYISRTFLNPTGNYTYSMIRMAGLAEVQHSLVFTCLTADLGNPCYFAWAGSNGAKKSGNQTTQRVGPDVFIGNTLRASAAGYSSFGGSDAIVAQFDFIDREVASELASDGLQIHLVDDSAVMNPNNLSLYYADGFHPNTAGHALIAQSYENAIMRALVPKDRGASQIFQGVNACALNGGFAIKGCPPGIQRQR